MKTLKKALLVCLVLFVLCGLIYPLGMTGLSQLMFHKQANGSMLEYNGKTVGSDFLGQSFTDMRFFHGRVSAVGYNTYKQTDTPIGVSSGSANLAPSNPVLAERVKKDMEEFLKLHPGVNQKDIPADLLTSSGSGLDPHISPQAAAIQLPAVAKATGISRSDLEAIIKKSTEERQWGIFGEPRVNVLKANIEIAKRLNL